MISLYNYIKKDWTVGGSRSSKLLIFDVDDTLINTTAAVNIVKNGKIIKSLSNGEYNTYELKPGEKFDYSEFRDPDLLSKETFTRKLKGNQTEYKRTEAELQMGSGSSNL